MTQIPKTARPENVRPETWQKLNDTEKKDGNKRLKPGRLLELIDLVTKRNKLEDDIKQMIQKI